MKKTFKFSFTRYLKIELDLNRPAWFRLIGPFFKVLRIVKRKKDNIIHTIKTKTSSILSKVGNII